MNIVNINEDMCDGVALVKSELRQACAMQASLSCRTNVASLSISGSVFSGPTDRVIFNITAVVNAQLKIEGWKWDL